MNDSPAMALKPDTWLTEMLGKPAWHLTPSGRELELVPLPQGAGFFIDVKIPARDIRTMNRLEDAGFRLIDTNVQLQRRIWPASQTRCSRFATPADQLPIERIAEKEFRYSRFHLDPQIGQSVANKIKRNWAKNFFMGTRGKYMITAEVNGEVAGFMQILQNFDTIIYDLCAVDSRYRGMGLAQDMINFAEANILDISFAQLGTQLANSTAMRTWLNSKFEFSGAMHVLHYHG